METIIIMLVGWAVSGILGLVGGGISASLMRYLDQKDIKFRVAALEEEVESLYKTEKSMKGHDAKAEQTQQMEAALAEAAMIMQDTAITDKKGALLGLATKYPLVAMKLAKKMGFGL